MKINLATFLFMVSIILLCEMLVKQISACGSIASGCPGKCQEGYYCGPFWAGQCACFPIGTTTLITKGLLRKN